MARKVFISFLGTNNYLPTHYGLYGISTEKPVRYVQEALIDFICPDWSEDDRIIIFCTEKSYTSNWLDDGHEKSGNIIKQKGLNSELKEKRVYSLIENGEPVIIKEGFTEDEIWEIFDIVYSKLLKDDLVYLDITHAFRSIPMFTTVLLNYAEFLKDIKIQSIHYGAFEKLGPAYKVEKIPIEERLAPILDLSNLITLQQITQATSEFVNYGKMGKIGDSTPMFDNNDSKRNRRFNQSLHRMRKNLKQIDDDISACRIDSIYNATIIKLFFEDYKTLMKYKDIPPAQRLIFEKIYKKMNKFKNEAAYENVILAALWAYDNGMLQQAYTIGQEVVISLVAERFKDNEFHVNFDNETHIREFIGAILAIDDQYINQGLMDPSNFKEPLRSKSELVNRLLEIEWVLELRKEYKNISVNRNIINHGKGINPFDELRDGFYEPFKKCITIMGYPNLFD